MKILLATDGSERATAVAKWLGRFPLPRGARVTVASIADLRQPPLLEGQSITALRESLVADARRAAETTRELLKPYGTETDVRIGEGDPREELVRLADEAQTDLVVVGARGLGTVKRLLLGSVSEAVARHAPCAVLVVKDRPRPVDTVVVALDGSESAFQALEFLTALDLPPGLAVKLVGVVEETRFPSSAPRLLHRRLRAALKRLQLERRRELKAALGRAAAALKGRVKTVEMVITQGRTADKILAAATPDVGLIVVGARGLGPVKRFLLGSVSEHVLRHARCPVLVVRKT